MDEIAILLVGTKPEVEGRLATALGQHQAIRSVAAAGGARGLLHGARPKLAVVWLDATPQPEALELVGELAAKKVLVVGVGARKDPELILAAMRAGAREYLEDGDGEGLERSVQRLLEASGALRLGKITAVLPVKGGMGATTLATNLAGAIQRTGKRVCVADLNLELGDVLSFLDVRGTYSLSDVAANTRRLDRELLDQSVPRHDSGVWVLSQTEKLAEGDGLDPEKAVAVLRFLRPHYDHLLVDGLRGFDDMSLAALDLADHILLLVTQEVPAVRDAQRCAEIFGRLGYDPARILLVVNRYQGSSTITTKVIEETVGLPVAATVGNDFSSLTRAVNRGVLLQDEAPRSVVARDLRVLAERIAPSSAEAAHPSMLRRLFSRRTVAHGVE